MRYSELTEGVNGILYHGTSTLYRDEILKNGIGDPSHWGTQKVAMGFAKQKCRDKGGEPMIIAVSMSEFDQWQFSIDDNMIDFPIYKDASARAERWRKSEQDWRACLKIYGAVVYDAPIYVSATDIRTLNISEDSSNVPSLVPAILYNDMIFRGEKGQAHIQIAHEYGMPQMASDGERGFCDENGNFLNRKDAMAYAQQHNLLKPNIKTVGHDGFEYDLMSDHLKEDALADIKDFKNTHNNPMIDKRVHGQSARRNPSWKRNLVDIMKKYGFALVGAGINGAVFQNPEYPYVLKVYRNDQGYDEFVHFMLTNKGNKFIPKIQGQPVRLNNIFKAIRLEPLSPCPDDKAIEFCDKMDAIDRASWKNKEEVAGDPELAKLGKFVSEWGPHTDVTPHNLMVRANGQVVLVDPIYINPDYKGDW